MNRAKAAAKTTTTRLDASPEISVLPVGIHLALQLGYDEASPPAQGPLGPQNVRKHVVAHVQKLSCPNNEKERRQRQRQGGWGRKISGCASRKAAEKKPQRWQMSVETRLRIRKGFPRKKHVFLS